MIKRLTEGNNVISYHARQKGCTRKFQTYARVHPEKLPGTHICNLINTAPTTAFGHMISIND